MPLLWIGAILVALKWIGLEPVAGWSWWWVVSPLLLAVVWWEWLERMLGLDRRAPKETRQGRSITRKGR